MKTIRVDLYEYDELSETAKDAVLDNMRGINTDDFDWWDFAFEDYKECGRLMGIDITNICFSGFSSQGDGACFEGDYSYNKGARTAIKGYAGTDKELHRIAEELFQIQRKYFFRLTAHVEQSGHYSHKYSTVFDITDSETGDYVDCDELIEVLRDFMQWMYKHLEAEYDGLRSDEAVIDTIEANEYYFTENGELK